MAPRDAKIRRFEPSDDKVVRFAIGKAAMESLAVANRRGVLVSVQPTLHSENFIQSTAYVHPLVIAAWMLLSYAIISFMDLWPVEKNGLLGYLRPIPMLAASTVPIMFLIDW